MWWAHSSSQPLGCSASTIFKEGRGDRGSTLSSAEFFFLELSSHACREMATSSPISLRLEESKGSKAAHVQGGSSPFSYSSSSSCSRLTGGPPARQRPGASLPAGEADITLTCGPATIQVGAPRLRMAAVVRGGHPVQGGRGRGHGRGRRGGAAADPEPAQVLTPVGFQWHFWKEGNSNKSRKPSKEEELELRIYKELEKDPRVHPDELYMYGVSAGLLHQEDNIVTMLHDVVELYNRMATTRRRYLFKKMHDAWGTEMSLMLKKIQSDSELAMSLVEDIHTAKGYCPATPRVFTALPKLK